MAISFSIKIEDVSDVDSRQDFKPKPESEGYLEFWPIKFEFKVLK